MASALPLAQYGATVILDLAGAVALGAGVLALSAAPRKSAWSALLRPRLRLAHLAALVLTLAASVVVLWLEAAAMAEVPLVEAGDAVWSMLTATHFGKAWIAGAGLLLVASIAAILAVPGARRTIKRAPIASSVLALAAFLYTRSMVSHAAANGDFNVPMLADWVHLVLISVWIGEVCIAGILTLSTTPADSMADRIDCRDDVVALSRSATFALVGIAATGLFSAWHNLGTAGALVDNPYRTLLLFKLALVALAVALGGLNRFFVMPSLTSGLAGTGPLPVVSLHRFVAILRVEAIVLSAVLILAAILSSTAPPGADEVTAPVQSTPPKEGAR